MVYNSARRQDGDRGTEMADTADKGHSAPGGPWALLPEEGVKELADRLTEYMTEIEMTDLPAVLEQVLDDFLVQCDGVPEDLEASDAVDRIVNGQLAVTMAYHLGRLEGRAPQLVERFVQEALEKWGHIHLEDETRVTDEDLDQLVERVLPKLRRWRYYLGRESEEA